MCTKVLLKSLILVSSLLGSEVFALPVLQIGPDPSDSGAYYDAGTQTWMFSGTTSFSFNIYNTGDAGLTAYLVFAAIPSTATDAFDIAVSDDGGALSLYDSGYGTPPFSDPNSLAPHGIYDTWSEIYQVTFDGPQITIGNTQPGDPGTGLGYVENITVDLSSLNAAGLHIDLFTADYSATSNKQIVTAFAPFSHDGEFVPGVPVPPAVWLFASGLLGLVGVARRKHVDL